MIKVQLVAHTNANPLELTSHAALICYQAEMPEVGKILDVENRLFKVGHHTTLQHFFFTFAIEGIAVGDITFGMHLASPFYNSDQRSGRYCAKMFTEPNFEEIKNYVKTFWPEVNEKNREEVMDYVKKGVGIYHDNISAATELAKTHTKEERPYANEKYIEQNGPKIAQEQMRSFIPVIFPTAFDFTINMTVLAALHRVAWTPVMRDVTQKMVDQVKEKFPEIAFMFAETDNHEWAISLEADAEINAKYKPALKLLGITGEESFIMPEPKIMHPIDKLHFLPDMMDNSFGSIETEIEISVATMGQDQRHRTIKRSKPKFTGNFYIPPIVKELELETEAVELMKKWAELSQKIPKTLSMILAPYGAMVSYKKNGSFNAIAHEHGKRLCWCAQEEIYHVSRLLRLAINERNQNSPLLTMFEPGCYRTGICVEGSRYCGRNINIRKTGDYFPERKV
ncbi:MAG: FAD-dependent thymidylate synthase [Patescibacteria group bacterium]